MPKPDPRTTSFAHADMLDGRDLQARLRYLLNDKEDGLLTDTERGDRALLLEISAMFAKPLENYVFVNYDYMPTYAKHAAEHRHGRETLESWPFSSRDWDDAADKYAEERKLKEVEIGTGVYYVIS